MFDLLEEVSTSICLLSFFLNESRYFSTKKKKKGKKERKSEDLIFLRVE